MHNFVQLLQLRRKSVTLLAVTMDDEEVLRMESHTIALPTVVLKSAPGISTKLSCRTFGHVARKAEEDAAELRFQAKDGLSHPRVVRDLFMGAKADLAALREAHEQELTAIDTALKALAGEAMPTSAHPLVRTAQEMRHTSQTFARAKSGLARDKANALLDDTRSQLKATRDTVSRALTEQLHRVTVLERKCADALRHTLAVYAGPIGISMKEASEILGLKGIPHADNTRELPAANASPFLPARHPARLANTLRVICASKVAAAELAEANAEAKRRRLLEKPRETIDDVRDALKLLGDK
jgi:hypothetical protein